MKKIVALLCVICLMVTPMFSAFAQDYEIGFKVLDVAEDLIEISGSAPNDTLVTVLVLNPGYTIDDIDYSESSMDSAVVQCSKVVLSKNGTFSANVKIVSENGGDFTVCVFNGVGVYSDTIPFFPYTKKASYIQAIKSAKNATTFAEKVPEIFGAYGYTEDELYKALTPLQIATSIVSENGQHTITTPINTELFLRKMLVFSAYKYADDMLVDADSKLKYADLLGIAENDWYEDYVKTILSEEGLKALNAGLFAKNCKNLKDINDEFTSLMCYHSIINNVYMGGGHVEGILDKYSSYFKAEGFKIENIDSFNNKNEIFAQIVGAKPENLSLLKDLFNESFKKKENSGSQNTNKVPSSGGGGGGASVPKPTETPAPTATPTPSNEPEPTAPQSASPFSDMSGADWAKEAVEYLYNKGIINGRSENTFAPNDVVTRAELVKMIVEAFEVADSGNDKEFGDVNSDDWFAQYVKKAAGAGIVNGSDGVFRPNGGVTREDAAVIIFRAMGISAEEDLSFTDKDAISDYAKEAIAALCKGGIINGMGDGSFAPKATLTRAQAAQLIFGAINKGGMAQ